MRQRGRMRRRFVFCMSQNRTLSNGLESIIASSFADCKILRFAQDDETSSVPTVILSEAKDLVELSKGAL